MLIDQFYAQTKSIAFDVGYLREHERNTFSYIADTMLILLIFCTQYLFKDIFVKICMLKLYLLKF